MKYYRLASVVSLCLLIIISTNCDNGRGRQEVPPSVDGVGTTEKVGTDTIGTPEPTPRPEPPPGQEPPAPREPATRAEPPPPRPDAGVTPEKPVLPEPSKETAPEPPPVGSCEGTNPLKSGEQKLTIKHDNVTRTFYVYIPPQYTGKTKLPVLLNFHGLNSNSTQQKLLTNMNTLAAKKGFIAIHAEGRGLPQSWNGGLCCSPASSVLKSKDVDFVRAMLDDIEKKMCIDSKRIYATGISNGAYISYRLACDLSDRIAAIAPVAGIQLIMPCKPKRPLSVIAFHGTADLIVPFEGRKIIGWPSVNDSVGFWTKHNGCQPAAKRVYTKGDTYCDEWSGCQNNTRTRLCVTKDGGHTWPGGFPIPGLGKTTKDINATEALWDFVSQHRLP